MSICRKKGAVNTATVSGIQGTGLGLSVCRVFVNAMGGTISCSSKQGEGSTFTVTLPFRIREVTEDEVWDDGPSGSDVVGCDLAGRRVLLVEDNELNLEIAEDILTEEGMEVETANDGTVAVDRMRDRGPDYYDFILMDIQMPTMNGYEATGMIRQMYPQSDIPIIALSANAFTEDREASIKAGMNDHVAKPINVSELNRVISKYIKHKE